MPRHTSATPFTYCTWPPVNDACSFPPDDMLLDNNKRYEDFRLNQLWLPVQQCVEGYVVYVLCTE